MSLGEPTGRTTFVASFLAKVENEISKMATKSNNILNLWNPENWSTFHSFQFNFVARKLYQFLSFFAILYQGKLICFANSN